jgi:hypothetical protein
MSLEIQKLKVWSYRITSAKRMYVVSETGANEQWSNTDVSRPLQVGKDRKIIYSQGVCDLTKFRANNYSLLGLCVRPSLFRGPCPNPHGHKYTADVNYKNTLSFVKKSTYLAATSAVRNYRESVHTFEDY